MLRKGEYRASLTKNTEHDNMTIYVYKPISGIKYALI